MNWWDLFKEWFLSLGEKYNVNPFIFGSIYLGAVPFFFLSMAWAIKNIRNKKSVLLPVILTGFFFISAYLYLIIAGRNIPAWVYFFIAIMIGYGVYSTVQKIKSKKYPESSSPTVQDNINLNKDAKIHAIKRAEEKLRNKD